MALSSFSSHQILERSFFFEWEKAGESGSLFKWNFASVRHILKRHRHLLFMCICDKDAWKLLKQNIAINTAFVCLLV